MSNTTQPNNITGIAAVSNAPMQRKLLRLPVDGVTNFTYDNVRAIRELDNGHNTEVDIRVDLAFNRTGMPIPASERYATRTETFRRFTLKEAADVAELSVLPSGAYSGEVTDVDSVNTLLGAAFTAEDIAITKIGDITVVKALPGSLGVIGSISFTTETPEAEEEESGVTPTVISAAAFNRADNKFTATSSTVGATVSVSTSYGFTGSAVAGANGAVSVTLTNVPTTAFTLTYTVDGVGKDIAVTAAPAVAFTSIVYNPETNRVSANIANGNSAKVSITGGETNIEVAASAGKIGYTFNKIPAEGATITLSSGTTVETVTVHAIKIGLAGVSYADSIAELNTSDADNSYPVTMRKQNAVYNSTLVATYAITGSSKVTFNAGTKTLTAAGLAEGENVEATLTLSIDGLQIDTLLISLTRGVA